jgi:glutathione synthase/RimK-type ligase-like ATP-grasp enzyme
MHIALLTDARYVRPAVPGDGYHGNIHTEDRLLSEALAHYGVTTRRVDWADAAVDWAGFDAAVFRTTWDYFEKYAAFRAWLDAVPVPLVNAAVIIRENVDKRYLLALEAAGVAIVPTRLVERGAAADLDAVLGAAGWDEAVIKPTVSGGARNTYRVRRGEGGERFAALVAQEAMLVQPFVHDVMAGGEVSVMVFGGRVSHAVRKIAKKGDFRVQDDHGGTVHAHVTMADEVAFAERAVAACALPPVYARVDLVRDGAGALALMELELVEPELFLRMAPGAAPAFAAAIVGALRG